MLMMLPLVFSAVPGAGASVIRPAGVSVWDLLFAKRHLTVDARKSMEEDTIKERLALGTSTYVPSSGREPPLLPFRRSRSAL